MIDPMPIKRLHNAHVLISQLSRQNQQQKIYENKGYML